MSEPRKYKKQELQMKWVEETSSEEDESDSDFEPNQIEVHNVPDRVTDEGLKAYFEMTKSGGSSDAVFECRQVGKGVFIVTFQDPKGMNGASIFVSIYIIDPCTSFSCSKGDVKEP